MNYDWIEAEVETMLLTFEDPQERIIKEQALIEEKTKKVYSFLPEHVEVRVLSEPIGKYRYVVWNLVINRAYGFEKWKDAERLARKLKQHYLSGLRLLR